jgi:hypothetical protein
MTIAKSASRRAPPRRAPSDRQQALQRASARTGSALILLTADPVPDQDS